jgi:hypothetical protein
MISSEMSVIVTINGSLSRNAKASVICDFIETKGEAKEREAHFARSILTLLIIRSSFQVFCSPPLITLSLISFTFALSAHVTLKPCIKKRKYLHPNASHFTVDDRGSSTAIRGKSRAGGEGARGKGREWEGSGW